MREFCQFWRSVTVVAALAIAGCVTTSYDAEERILLGETNQETLYREFPDFAANHEAYQPDPAVIRQIANVPYSANILLFLGTWCSDSVSEAPKMLKVLAEAANPRLHVSLFALDQEKSDPKGFSKTFGVDYVPTLIVRQGGRELGRIVEYPKTSVEADLAEILGAAR